MKLRSTRRFRSDDTGAAAVEFSLIVPCLVGLLMAVAEFSFAFLTLTSAQHAVWGAARQLAVGQTTTSAAREAVVAALPRWTQGQATITAEQDPADANRYRVTATIPLSVAAPTNFFAALFGSRTMTNSATLMKEP